MNSTRDGQSPAALLLAGVSGAPGMSHGTTAMAGGAFGPAVTAGLAALLAAAMGIQNAVARKLAVPDMTTTVLTMTSPPGESVSGLRCCRKAD